MDLPHIKATLERAGVVFDRGLDESELRAVEARYGFRFPPDLAAFLAHALAISSSWVDWRSGDEEAIRERLAWPYEGICFDVQHNGFWLDEWGPRPDKIDDAFAVVKQAVDRAPRLIPICSHRFLPERPQAAGNPVLSVYQTDIIYYGGDLEDYLANEFSYYFGRDEYAVRGAPVRRIDFWSHLVDLNE